MYIEYIASRFQPYFERNIIYILTLLCPTMIIALVWKAEKVSGTTGPTASGVMTEIRSVERVVAGYLRISGILKRGRMVGVVCEQ